MNSKSMKVVFLLVGLIMVGLGKKAEAGFYTTVRSSAVQVVVASSFSTGVEMLSVRWSSGSTVGNDQFLVFPDTIAVEYATSGLGQTLLGGTTLQNVLYGRGRYPNHQNIIPPIVVFSTITAVTNGATTVYNPDGGYKNLRDENGCGQTVNDGIAVLQPGVAYGTVVTVEWRPKPQTGPCRDQ